MSDKRSHVHLGHASCLKLCRQRPRAGRSFLGVLLCLHMQTNAEWCNCRQPHAEWLQFQFMELPIQRKDSPGLSISIPKGLFQPLKQTFCCGVLNRITKWPWGHGYGTILIQLSNRMTPCLASDSHGFQCFKLQGCQAQLFVDGKRLLHLDRHCHSPHRN